MAKVIHKRTGVSSYTPRVNLRDCMTMKFQDETFCANCYQPVGDLNYGKKFNEQIRSFDDTTTSNDNNNDNEDSCSTTTLAQALMSVFDLHQKSHLSSILLDENKYILCSTCLNVFSQLYALFQEFKDLSSSPSYLSSLIKRNPNTNVEPPLIIEIKAEPDDFFPDIDGFDEFYSSGVPVGSPDLSVISFSNNDDLEQEGQSSSNNRRKQKKKNSNDYYYYTEDISFENTKTETGSNEMDKNTQYNPENFDDTPEFIDEKIGQLEQVFDENKSHNSNNNNNNNASRITDGSTALVVRRRSGRPRKLSITKLESLPSSSTTTSYVKKSYIKKNYSTNSNKRKTSSALQSRNRKKTKTSVRSQIKQQQTSSFPCTECNAVFKLPHQLKRHMIQHTTKDFICDCNVGFSTEKYLKYHQRTICPNNVDAQKFISEYVYEEEQDGDADGDNNNEIDEEDDDSENERKRKFKKRKVVVCNLCKKKFKRRSTLLRHMERHRERPFVCDHCKQSFRANEILQLHILTSCPVLNSLGRVPLDDEMSFNITKDIDHSNNSNNNAIVPSNNNAVETTTVATIIKEDQQKSSGNENTASGSTAVAEGKTTGSQVKKIGKKYSYSCYCGATFSRSNHLFRHSLTHMENPHTCPDCYVKFVTQVDLDMHTKKHNGNCRRPCKRRQMGESGESKPKQSTCPICGRVVNAQSLKYHLESHGTEKKHVCEICGHAVKSKKTLNNHKTYAHSSTRRYLCRFCGRDFKTNQQLKFHEMRNHDDTEKMRKQAAKRQGSSTTTLSFNPSDYNIPHLPVEVLLQSELGAQVQISTTTTSMPENHNSNNSTNNLLMQEDYSNSNSQNSTIPTNMTTSTNNNSSVTTSQYQNIGDTSNNSEACTSETLQILKLTIQQQLASNLIAQTPLNSLDSSSRLPSSQNIQSLSHLYPHHSFPLHRPFSNIPQQQQQQKSQLQQQQLQNCISPPAKVDSSECIDDRPTFSQHSAKDFQQQ